MAYFPVGGGSDLAGELLRRAPASVGSAAPQQPAKLGQPPMTTRYGYKGGGLMSDMANKLSGPANADPTKALL